MNYNMMYIMLLIEMYQTRDSPIGSFFFKAEREGVLLRSLCKRIEGYILYKT